MSAGSKFSSSASSISPPQFPSTLHRYLLSFFTLRNPHWLPSPAGQSSSAAAGPVNTQHFPPCKSGLEMWLMPVKVGTPAAPARLNTEQLSSVLTRPASPFPPHRYHQPVTPDWGTDWHHKQSLIKWGIFAVNTLLNTHISSSQPHKLRRLFHPLILVLALVFDSE